MNKLLPIQFDSNDSYELPAEVRTLNGAQFDPRADKWSYRDSTFNVSIDFNSLKASIELISSVKKALIWYAENKSPNHLMNMFSYFKRYLKHAHQSCGESANNINIKDVLNFRASYSERDSYFLGSLSGFFQKWHDLGFPGVTDDAVALLKQLRIKGNRKGEAVLTMDPENGPYTDIELGGIRSALDECWRQLTSD